MPVQPVCRAVAQLPWWRKQKVLVRVDGAGFSRGLLQWIASAGGRRSPTFRREYSTGWAITDREHAAVEQADRRGLWQPATDADGNAREDAFVADLTGLLGDPSGRPPHHKAIARKEPLHPRRTKDAPPYELAKEMRYQTLATNTRHRQARLPDARHREHARAEPRTRDPKASGIRLPPSREMPANTARPAVTAIACDPRARLQLPALDGDLAKATPKTLRHRILHAPARLARGQRRRRPRQPTSRPRADATVRALQRIHTLPRPT